MENQLQPLQEAAGRLGWTVVAIYRDEGISGTKGRDKRPGLDAMLKGVARREFDIVAAWSVCRLGRSLSDLIGLLGELRSRDIDLYLHAAIHWRVLLGHHMLHTWRPLNAKHGVWQRL